MRRLIVGLAAVALAATAGHANTITHGTTTINMDFVTVDNPGNTADDTTYGRVDYEYKIGKYEVTENQWDAVVAADTNDLLDNPGNWSGDQPVANISWYEAAMFSNWLTSGDVSQGVYEINGGAVTGIERHSAVSTYGVVYVIPTENEWYKAAYYDPSKPGYWDYPTKHDDPNEPDGIDSAGDTEFDAVFYDGYSQGHPNAVDDAGALSAYGTMGQGGNVWEWNETAIASSRGVRGGDCYVDSFALHVYFRGDGDPAGGSYGLGFRVASIPELSTLALLCMGTLALLAYAWRRRRTA